ncbi:MAG: hypothetical protein JWP29_5643 [Rhodoferax sp.]|nr:hypothetical protein [Rhodoferax sp.]
MNIKAVLCFGAGEDGGRSGRSLHGHKNRSLRVIEVEEERRGNMISLHEDSDAKLGSCVSLSPGLRSLPWRYGAFWSMHVQLHMCPSAVLHPFSLFHLFHHLTTAC